MIDYRTRIDEISLKLSAVKESVKQARADVVNAESNLVDADEARSIIQHVGQQLQETAHARIAGVVSRCLEVVFDEPYEFKIIFEKKRNQTEARLVFIRDGLEVNPIDASGGGVVDVAAFALRLACISLRRPRMRRFVVLDEPWKHLSENYRPALCELVTRLAEEMDFQFLIVTHSREFEIGKIIRLGE